MISWEKCYIALDFGKAEISLNEESTKRLRDEFGMKIFVCDSKLQGVPSVFGIWRKSYTIDPSLKGNRVFAFEAPFPGTTTDPSQKRSPKYLMNLVLQGSSSEKIYDPQGITAESVMHDGKNAILHYKVEVQEVELSYQPRLVRFEDIESVEARQKIAGMIGKQPFGITPEKIMDFFTFSDKDAGTLNRKHYHWAIYDGDVFVGYLSLRPMPNWAKIREPGKFGHVRVIIKRDFRRRGYGEASLQLLNMDESVADVKKYLLVHSENEPMIKMMAKMEYSEVEPIPSKDKKGVHRVFVLA